MICMIEADNHITTFNSAPEAQAARRGDCQQFRSAKELAKWLESLNFSSQ